MLLVTKVLVIHKKEKKDSISMKNISMKNISMKNISSATSADVVDEQIFLFSSFFTRV